MKNYKYGQELPAEVESKLDAYIERVKAIKWFKPSASIDKSAVEKQVSVVLKAFGVEASLEYRTLKTPQDWDFARVSADAAAWNPAWEAARFAAWNVVLDAALAAARYAALNAVQDVAWDVALDSVLDAARYAVQDAVLGDTRDTLDAALDVVQDAAQDAAQAAAQDAAMGSADLLGQQMPTFLHLIPLYELGLWPIGVVDGKFVVAVPSCLLDFPEIK